MRGLRSVSPGESVLRSSGTRPPFARDDFFTSSEREGSVIPGATIPGVLSLDNGDPFIDDDEFAIDDP